MNRYAAFFAALKAAEQRTSQKIDRTELIYDFTKGRTHSLKDLSQMELVELIKQLQSETVDKSDRMRKKVISCLKYQGYTTENGRADMNRIYAWVRKYGYLKKELNQYNEKELPGLVYQAEQMKSKYIDSL